MNAEKEKREAKLTDRLVILVDKDLTKQLEDYRFSIRAKSHGDAVRQLLELGLKTWHESKDND
jgi:hypothetical protein